MLKELEPSKVFYYFEEISRIPRGSGNTTAISNYLVEFAKKRGLAYRQDAYENVIIWKDASAGYEHCKTVMLQGHMDMVCEKELDCTHDFLKDGLQLKVAEDYVYAEGTTLGGDDGIAVAYALAILDDDTIKHPALEVVFTTDEETGMNGAIGLDCSDLKSQYFINIDSEEEGTILTSCAGGMTVNASFPIRKLKKTGYVVDITLKGLQGGHSGTEIDKNRENAVYMLGRMLTALKHRSVDYRLMEINGGLKDNAIPRSAQVKLLVKEKESATAQIQSVMDMIKKELENSEPKAEFIMSVSELQTTDIIEDAVTKKVAFFLEQTPNGVQRMSAAISGLVESSLNMGICKTDEHEIMFSFSLRSSLQSYKEYMKNKLKDLIQELGGIFTEKSEYPAWEYRADSPLRELMVRVYEEQYGEKPSIEAIHAGLECGILAGKMPELDMVSIGPDILDIHTPKERLVISSTQRVYKYLLRVLEEMK